MKSLLVVLRSPALLLLSVCIFFIGLGYGLTLPFMPLFGVERAGMSPLSLGIFMACGSLSGIIISTLFSRLSDKKPVRKWIIVGSCVSASVGYVFYANTDSYIVLMLVSCTFMALSFSAFPQLFALAREVVEREASEDVTVVMAVLRALVSLAWILGPVMASFIIYQFSYTGLFLVVSLMYMLVAVFVLMIRVHESREPGGGTELSSDSVRSFKRLLMAPQIVFSLLAFMAFELANTMGGIVTPLYVTQELQGGKLDVGMISGVNAALQVPTMIILGILAKRFGSITVMKCAGLFGVAYFSLFWFTQSGWQIIAIQIFSAIFIAIVLGVGMTFFQDLVPKMTGTATTLYNNANIIGSMGGGLLAGAVGNYFGFKIVIACSAALAFLGFVLLLVPNANKEVVRHVGGDTYES
ncbi:sugar efflux transporter [Paenibacillus sp. FSL E2-0151]|uniref:sugar efflux transporter n=1 Tax=Paenibacillus sp. FSL E2-0151 TaxID=2921357 RepID=UPI0030EF2851